MLEKITIVSEEVDGNLVWGIEDIGKLRPILLLADKLDIPIEFKGVKS